MALATPSSPHNHMHDSVTRVMLRVIYALVPGIIAYIYFFGWGIVINMLFAALVALLCESLMLVLRGRPLAPFLSDGSALVTACLLALTLPPLSPWWITVLGVGFAIIFAKHLYGGLGYNPFNPAMAGYAMLLISFPREMTTWFPPQTLTDTALSFTETLSFISFGELPSSVTLDAISRATPLDTLKTQLGLEKSVDEIMAGDSIFGTLGGIGWEWVNIGFLLGGLWLVYRRVINWHIPAGVLVSLAIISSLFYFVDSVRYASPIFHLFSGATMLGAFFIATDPVSAATTAKGRVIFGIGIGVLLYIIRTWGGYPDAIAFSVLLMNMVAPTIDHFTQPRVYGHK